MIRKNKLTRKNMSTRNWIFMYKIHFLVDLFFLVNLFFLIDFLHEAALKMIWHTVLVAIKKWKKVRFSLNYLGISILFVTSFWNFSKSTKKFKKNHISKKKNNFSLRSNFANIFIFVALCTWFCRNNYPSSLKKNMAPLIDLLAIKI